LSLVYYTPPTHPFTLPLHDALPISPRKCGADGARTGDVDQMTQRRAETAAEEDEEIACQLPHEGFVPHGGRCRKKTKRAAIDDRSEEHTSELQSRFDLVCRLLLENK